MKAKINDKFESNKYSSPKISSDSKADFPQQVKESMKWKFHKCVVNVTPVTNPTPTSKSDKYIVEAIEIKI